MESTMKHFERMVEKNDESIFQRKIFSNITPNDVWYLFQNFLRKKRNKEHLSTLMLSL